MLAVQPQVALRVAGVDLQFADHVAFLDLRTPLHARRRERGRVPRGRPLDADDRVLAATRLQSPGALDALFARYPVSAVLHLAGVKAVGESVALPLYYHEVNVAGTLTLAQAMHAAGVRTLVFSSSATVYGALAGDPELANMPAGSSLWTFALPK